MILAGNFEATFVPAVSLASLGWGFGIYWVFLLIPMAMHVKEAIVWHISISRI